MRRRTLVAAAIAAAAVCQTALVASPVSALAAVAATTPNVGSTAAAMPPVITKGVPISTDTPRAMAIAGGHVFVATRMADPRFGAVLVSGLDGANVGTIAGVNGADILIANSDATRVYAMSPRDRAIHVIDAASATLLASYVLPEGCIPNGIADLGSTLWFGYGLCGDITQDTDAGVGVIDLSASAPTATLVTRDRIWYGPVIGGSPLAPTTLLMTANDAQRSINRFTVSGTTLTAAETVTPPGCGQINALPVSASGIVRVACVTETTSTVDYHAVDLTPAGSLPAHSPLAGGVTGPNGFVVVGRYADYRAPASWYVYAPDGALRKSYGFGNLNRIPDFVMWGPNGNLYGVSDLWDGLSGSDNAYLHVMTSPTTFQDHLTLAGNTPVTVTAHVVLQGALTSTDLDPSAVADRTLTVTRVRVSDGALVALPAVTTRADGTFTLSDAAPIGRFRYVASLASDGTHDRASVTGAAITVGRATPVLTVSITPKHARYGQTVTIRGQLKSPLRNRVLSLYAYTLTVGNEKPHLIKRATVGANGVITATYRATQSTSFILRTAGDASFTASEVYAVDKMPADITLTQKGYYATSGTYRMYHHTATPHFSYGLKPWPVQLGWPAEWTLQRRTSAGWSTVEVKQFPIARNDAILVDPSKTGLGTFRIRMEDLGDTYNGTGTSPWAYFRIVR